ncbi:MAG: galactose-1-phosphate uridylyltransferase [Cytophagales bacterium]|nr:galactose-1-phosphate uridylyltransferase [Cytophagales bacterium]MDW8384981.1 galactose-1-phosphate uridylyltransferase [Flammeovirgaceae bacterium]
MKDTQQYEGKWEKRWHPLRDEWIVYAAHRNTRPWSFEKKPARKNTAPEYDENCYLCPGNLRVHGDRNPDYKDIFIFDNDHPVVGLHSPTISPQQREFGGGLYRKEKAHGIARVVCYDPRHNVTLSEVSTAQVAKVFLAWKLQMIEFSKMEGIRYTLIFENKGEVVGVSNPHPHCQIYSTDFIFTLIQKEIEQAAWYRKEYNKNIFEQIIVNELEFEKRIIAENSTSIAFIPFFARYAYEVMVMPKRRHATLITMSETELYDLAQAFQEVQRRYDVAFDMSFPYVMTIHQAPIDGKEYPDYHLYISILPPYRQPGLIKYLAGPEIGGGNFMADTIPEEKAQELRSVDLSDFQEYQSPSKE